MTAEIPGRPAYTFHPVGIIHSPFREKFAIPRQSGIARSARSRLELLPPYASMDALRGLENVTHLWLLFVFHDIPPGSWSPTVRPPRLGGNERMGVFATRSPFRPNPIGLSAAGLEGVQQENGKIHLLLRGADLLDGTPVIDIKPYVPYADSIAEASNGYADHAPPPAGQVSFSQKAEAACATRPGLRELIVEILQQDPRPAYRRQETEGRIYGVRLMDVNVRWKMVDGAIRVTTIDALPAEKGE